MKRTIGVILTVGVAVLAAIVLFNTASTADKKAAPIERGRYLAKIAGCNDCHTPGYMAKNGKVDEAVWLTGDSLGWQGPWGTTYPINLRLYMQNITEEQWLQTVPKLQSRPPMPFYALQDMSQEDLVAIYRFVRSLGPAGTAAPAYLPPGVEASLPVVRFIPPPQG